MTHTFIARCNKCKKVARFQGVIGEQVANTNMLELSLSDGGSTKCWYYMGICYALVDEKCCGRRVDAKLVEAKVTDHNCDGSCTSAKSHKCACKCGGLNHGKDLVSVGSWWS